MSHKVRAVKLKVLSSIAETGTAAEILLRLLSRPDHLRATTEDTSSCRHLYFTRREPC